MTHDGDMDSGWGEASRYAAHLDRGWSRLEKGDMAAARRSAEEAHKLRPEDPDAPLLLAAAAAADGRSDEALSWYDEAIALDTEFPEPYLAAAHLALHDAGDPVRALAYCERALDQARLTFLEVLETDTLAVEAELALGHDAHARARLAELLEFPPLLAGIALWHPERPPPHRDALRPEEAEAVDLLYFDADGEPYDADERLAAGRRLLNLALHLVQLSFDLGLAAPTTRLLLSLTQAFEDEPDVWHAMSGTSLQAGALDFALDAAVRTWALDRERPIPEHIPAADILLELAHDILHRAPVAAVRELVERRFPLQVAVHEHVPLEIILEAADPRMPVLAVAAASEGDAPFLSGLVLYRCGLGRHVAPGEDVPARIRALILDEVSLALQLSDEDRAAMGLSPVGTDAPPPAEDTED